MRLERCLCLFFLYQNNLYFFNLKVCKVKFLKYHIFYLYYTNQYLYIFVTWETILGKIIRMIIFFNYWFFMLRKY